jgi:XTP/dITP diphosphohydrolase
MRIYLVTTSEFKAAEMQDCLNTFKTRTPINLEISVFPRKTREILHSDLEYIVRNKALEAYEFLTNRCLVEQSGLFIDALPNLPKGTIRPPGKPRLFGAVGQIIWEAVGDQMCDFVGTGVPRDATARSFIGYCDGRRISVHGGETRGRVAERSRGAYNCNWDPIFIPEGSELTYGEMGMEGKRKTSPTVKALEAFLKAEFSGDQQLS